MNRYLLIAVLAFSDTAHALNLTGTYICTYPSYSNAEGLHKTDEDFTLTFIVDKEADKSYLLGNNGSSEVMRLESDTQISFLELTGTRNVMATTIDANLLSVHSRNSVLSGNLMPSQYYGKCKYTE